MTNKSIRKSEAIGLMQFSQTEMNMTDFTKYKTIPEVYRTELETKYNKDFAQYFSNAD